MMQQAGITVGDYDEDYSSLILNIPLTVVNCIGTIISVIIIDKVGRRGVILMFTPFTAVSWFVTAIGMYLTGSESTKETGGIIATAGILCFLLSFSIGMGTAPWTLNSEIYPIFVIGTANSLSAFTNWTSNAILAEVFPLVTNKGIGGEVFIYSLLGCFSIACVIFTYFLIPETAQKTIEENLHAILGPDFHKKKHDGDD